MSNDPAVTNKIANLDLHKVAAAQLAIYGEIEESPIAKPSVLMAEVPTRKVSRMRLP